MPKVSFKEMLDCLRDAGYTDDQITEFVNFFIKGRLIIPEGAVRVDTSDAGIGPALAPFNKALKEIWPSDGRRFASFYLWHIPN